MTYDEKLLKLKMLLSRNKLIPEEDKQPFYVLYAGRLGNDIPLKLNYKTKCMYYYQLLFKSEDPNLDQMLYDIYKTVKKETLDERRGKSIYQKHLVEHVDNKSLLTY